MICKLIFSWMAYSNSPMSVESPTCYVMVWTAMKTKWKEAYLTISRTQIDLVRMWPSRPRPPFHPRCIDPSRCMSAGCRHPGHRYMSARRRHAGWTPGSRCRWGWRWWRTGCEMFRQAAAAVSATVTPRRRMTPRTKKRSEVAQLVREFGGNFQSYTTLSVFVTILNWFAAWDVLNTAKGPKIYRNSYGDTWGQWKR